MSENTEERRFCTSCGAPLRADNEFCTSCGKPVQSADQVVTIPPVDQSSGSAEQVANPTVSAASDFFGRAWSWVRGLPKWVFVAAGVLVLLVILSPVTSKIAIVATIVLVVVLIVQAFRGRPVGIWAKAAGVSLVLAIGLPFASSALYGGGGGGPGVGNSGTGGGSASERQYGVSGRGGAETSPCDLLDPELRIIAEEWASQDPEEVSGPLYLPTFVPFRIVSATDSVEYPELYEIRGDGEVVKLTFVDDLSYTSDLPDEIIPGGTVVMEDGESHPYVIEGEVPEMGSFSVVFGNASQGETIPLQLRLNATITSNVQTIDVNAQGFYDMLSSMVQIEPGSEC